jgi:hypothetical protein
MLDDLALIVVQCCSAPASQRDPRAPLAGLREEPDARD